MGSRSAHTKWWLRWKKIANDMKQVAYGVHAEPYDEDE